MEISIHHEMIVFWSAFICGQAICILFDFFRSLRKNISHSKTFVTLEDIIFCSVSFKIFFDTCYYTNNGRLRWYIFASIIGSAVLYFCIESKYIIKLYGFIFKIFAFIMRPFAATAKFLKRIYLKCYLGAKHCISSAFVRFWNKIMQFVTKNYSKPQKTKE